MWNCNFESILLRDVFRKVICIAIVSCLNMNMSPALAILPRGNKRHNDDYTANTTIVADLGTQENIMPGSRYRPTCSFGEVFRSQHKIIHLRYTFMFTCWKYYIHRPQKVLAHFVPPVLRPLFWRLLAKHCQLTLAYQPVKWVLFRRVCPALWISIIGSEFENIW